MFDNWIISTAISKFDYFEFERDHIYIIYLILDEY